MPNRPGALTALVRLLSDRKINLVGIASEVRDDSGLVRLAVEGNADVSSILSQAGFASVETSLLSVEVDDKPGELARAAEALSDAKINVTMVYGTSAGEGHARILVSAENIEKARAALEKIV